jgi:hypothetical protein
VLALLAVAAGGVSRAQAPSVRYTSEFDPKNFAHASFLGSGIYSVDGRKIFIVRIKSSFSLRSEEEHPWGLRLTLRPTVGFFDFRTSDSDRFDLPTSVGSLSVLPGVEFRVPVTSNWRLDPFVEAGPAMEFERNTVTWIYGLGTHSRADFSVGGGQLLLFNTLLWAGNWESSISPSDDFVVIEATLEWRYPIRWTLLGNPTSLGPWLRGEFYVDTLRIQPPEGEGVDVTQRYEVGLTWGPVEKVKKWGMPIPRVGLAVRFGQRELGYRLIFTSRF